jgi:hypothetical protein
MSCYLYISGSDCYYVRVGFSGQRPLIYAIYATNSSGMVLPVVPGQTYREITQSQYEWLRHHLCCDVSYIRTGWSDQVGSLECRTHREFYHLLDDELFISDLWDDREI